MRIDLSELMERGEGPVLLFEKKTGVWYCVDAGGQSHDVAMLEGYAVPVGDSIIRHQLKEIHVGCGGRLTDNDMDQLDSVFRVAGAPWVVDRGQGWEHSTENYVRVNFPAWSEQVPLAGSRLEKWGAYWGKGAVFTWWNCENEREEAEREEAEREEAEKETYS